MAVIYLVRHGQASFGAPAYDQLSPLGVAQARALGEALLARGLKPDPVLTGGHTRHRDTATACLAVLGDAGPAPRVESGWDEFDHRDVIEPHLSAGTSVTAMLDGALTRWVAAEDGYQETWTAFSERVRAALDDLATSLERSRAALVFTSGGPISAAAAYLLGGGTDLWLNLNRVVVNTGVTKLVTGRRGITLVSFNEHSHLDSDLLTYR